MFWLCMLSVCAFGQQTEKLVFGDSLCSATAHPLLLQKGTEVRIQCDSAYLINTIRYRMYLQLHRYIREEASSQQCQPLINAYERALADSHTAYQELKQQYHQSDQLSSQWIAESRYVLENIQQSVQHTENMISQSGKDLEEAKHGLRAERKKNIMQKIMAGVAGIGIGLLLAHL